MESRQEKKRVDLMMKELVMTALAILLIKYIDSAVLSTNKFLFNISRMIYIKWLDVCLV